MEKEKIIEEMARDICAGCRERHKCENNNVCAMAEIVATYLYNAGYRKERQGEWIRQDISTTGIEAKCSNCDREVVYQVIDNRWQFENYCPHCGAKMKGAE